MTLTDSETRPAVQPGKARLLHTMIRVKDLDKSLDFYTGLLGMNLLRKRDYPTGKFTLAFVGYGDETDSTVIELTHNWDTDRYERGDAYGHVAYDVPSIVEVQARLRRAGFDLSWGPGKTPDGRRAMAFVDDPDGYEIELLAAVCDELRISYPADTSSRKVLVDLLHHHLLEAHARGERTKTTSSPCARRAESQR